MQEPQQNKIGYAPRSAVKWISLATSPSDAWGRRRALAYWLMGNNFWKPPGCERNKGFPASRKPVFPAATVTVESDRVISLIKSGRLDPFDSVNRMIDFMKEQNKASTTVNTFRYHVIRFLRFSRLGLDPSDFAVAVKKQDRIRVEATSLPTPDQVRAIMLAASLKTKVLISMLISTGARIGEVRHVQKKGS